MAEWMREEMLLVPTGFSEWMLKFGMGRRWLGGFKRLEGAFLSQEMAYEIWRASMRMREEIVMRRRRDVTRIRVFGFTDAGTGRVGSRGCLYPKLDPLACNLRGEGARFVG